MACPDIEADSTRTSNREYAPLTWSSTDEIRRLQDVLANADYTENGISTALGTRDFRAHRGPDHAPWLRRTGGGSPLETLIRLFLLALPVEIEPARRAVAPSALETWVETGLIVIEGATAFAAVRLTPFQGFVLANDISGRDNVMIRPTFVMGVGSSSLTLANLTIRLQSRRTLDLGTGCGLQAFLAAPHSDCVVAVDRNPRAVNVAAFNAALNGLHNVEFLEGDRFAPVHGQTFDLIVSNPPFVISPNSLYSFRDSGISRDGICRDIVREAPTHLAEGGYCQILCNWAHIRGEDWRQRLAAWFEGTGCDAWVLRCETLTPDDYATTWIEHTERKDETTQSELYDLWMNHYEQAGIEAISAGLITMRKAGGKQNWFCADDAPSRMLGTCGDAIAQGFVQRDLLNITHNDHDFLRQPLQVAPEVVLQTMFVPSADGWGVAKTELQLTKGLAHTAEIQPQIAALIAQCREGRPLGEVIGPGKSIDADTMNTLRQLVAQGFLLPGPVSDRISSADYS